MPRVGASIELAQCLVPLPSSPEFQLVFGSDNALAQIDTYSPWTKSHLPVYAHAMKDDTDILKDFGQRVRELRRNQGFSQEAFAARCGLDRTYIGGIERGERNVALRNLAVIANRLGLSLSELFEGL